ncbi:MAG: L-seryl-tRNA(Sec) selenium transferase [Gammaproteobacteria bacterium]|nr:L-seryl-tRNA(Sec) selenium transferase [Gammaproteobacteria bacterium]MDH3409961.1 L-seryl-tRNA(Sec) selenium transferase [Gammaproteobacteria bacterium]MDH3553088.1 L-seryl-tRNA(Sec) selenium transferase [Gammaproteobacteria bacterium]
MSQALRQLPAIDRWLRSDFASDLCAEFGRNEVAVVMRSHLDRIRANAVLGVDPPVGLEDAAYFALLRADLVKRRCDGFRRVINATGIVIHTNLGRAPLADEAIEAVNRIAGSYSNLELGLQTGKRSSRYQHVEALLTRLSGAEAAVVVNNCAAAVLLALNTFCRDGEVVISRSELIEIGGSFRMPDVIARSGARMVEVGTTNRTHVSDFSDALSNETRALLSSHPSNYRISGFTAKPGLKVLAELARENQLLLMHDLGSGALVDLEVADLSAEPTVRACVAAGADVVMCSGDKLLGGPQAGLILGRAELIARIKQNPMLRAMRIDKLSLAALNATLRLYLPPNDPLARIPVLRMICEDKASIERRSRRALQRLIAIPGLEACLQDDVSFAGGGSLPMSGIPSTVIQLHHETFDAAELAHRLRSGEPPIISRIANDRCHLSLRTVLERDTEDLIGAVGRALE